LSAKRPIPGPHWARYASVGLYGRERDTSLPPGDVDATFEAARAPAKWPHPFSRRLGRMRWVIREPPRPVERSPVKRVNEKQPTWMTAAIVGAVVSVPR
jgi:hypothetical protein